MKLKISECPFCGHTQVQVREVERADDTYKAVVCLNCNAHGPLAAAGKTAVSRWNRLPWGLFHVFSAEDGYCVCGEKAP